MSVENIEANAGTIYWGKIQIPRRSEFYHIEPMGVGTPYVESLSSYAARLASEHFVTPAALMRRVRFLAPTLERTPLSSTGDSRAIIGAGIIASKLIKALETLTMRRDLSWTTMVTWVNVLSQRPLIRINRAWCAVCYQLWMESQKVVYDPLLWKLKAVIVCPVHNVLLTSSCPNCKAHFFNSIQQSYPGFCPRCKFWLGCLLREPARLSIDLESTEEAKWHLWKARSAGELLASAPNIKIPTRDQVARSLRYCIEKYSWGRVGRFTSQFKVLEGSLRSWLQDKGIPVLESILQLTYEVGVPLLDFLCGNIAMEACSANGEGKCKGRTVRKITTEMPLSYAKVKKILEAGTLSEEHASLQTFVRITGWDSSKLQHHFPDLCATILTHYADHYHRSIDESKALSILQAALLENPPPSLSALARRVGASPQGLKYRFPEIAAEIITRHTAHRYNADWNYAEKYMKKALSENTPSSLGEVSRSIGISVGRLRRKFPELTIAISRRFKEYARSQKGSPSPLKFEG